MSPCMAASAFCFLQSVPITMEYGEFCSALSVDVPRYKIKLWYPSGYGEPTLYQLKVKTTIRDVSQLSV